jgi:hypothetical protein
LKDEKEELLMDEREEVNLPKNYFVSVFTSKVRGDLPTLDKYVAQQDNLVEVVITKAQCTGIKENSKIRIP